MNKIEVRTLLLGWLATNCYIVLNKDTKECIIIDPAAKEQKIIELIEEENLIPKAVLLTHGHADHILAVDAIRDKYNIKVYLADVEKEIIENSDYNCANYLFRKDIKVSADIYVNDNEYLDFLDTKIKVILTSGHTKGSVCYYFENEKLLFTGDTVFKNTYGRTDLYSGNIEELKTSIIDKVFVLADDVSVFPGHGSPSLLADEKKYNEILRVR